MSVKKYHSPSYMEIKQTIDAKREALGIKVSPKNYNVKVSKPVSDEIKRKYQPEEGVEFYSTKVKTETSRKELLLDKAFAMYHASGCRAYPRKIAESIGLSYIDFYEALERANCMFNTMNFQIREKKEVSK